MIYIISIRGHKIPNTDTLDVLIHPITNQSAVYELNTTKKLNLKCVLFRYLNYIIN